MKKWNHYTCEECSQVTIARHDDEGVTPFTIRCRATPYCMGTAASCLFECPQNDEQKPHIVFFRPKTLAKAIEEIYKEKDYHTRKWLLEHYNKGGSLLKEVIP